MQADREGAAFDALLMSRHSVRAFAPTPVARSTVEDILRVAGQAPSNSNTQPWKVDVVAGRVKRRLTDAIMEEHRRDPSMPSAHFPSPLPAEYRDRQLAFGALFYPAYGIARGDADGMTRQLALNYDFYGAPVGLILSVEKTLRQHSWLDCGIFLQSLMLAAQARGLGTCPQVVFARFEATIARELGIPPDRSVICGMSLGVPDPAAPINNVVYPREPLSSFCRFDGFDED